MRHILINTTVIVIAAIDTAALAFVAIKLATG